MAKKSAHGVMDLPLVSQQEWEEVIVEWNQTAADYPRDRCVHELFERQAGQTPDAVAVVYEGEQLSYGEFDRRANQLAHYLREKGVGPEAKVGLCVQRGVWLVVGLMGVMKAGGAYVPVEAGNPAERLSYMMEESGCAVTVATSSTVEKLRGIKTSLVNLETDWEQVARRSDEKPGVAIGSDNAAYVIYTSGSTGRPKGVEVGHRQLVNYATALARQLQPSGGASFALVSTIAADLGNTMVYPSLLGGGRLHVISRERAWDAEGLSEYFGREQIDYLKIVPSHLKALNGGGGAGVVMPTRVLVIGGESAGAEWIKEWSRRKPGCRIMNHYGPTEATVGALTQTAGDAERWETGSGTMVLGRPIGNAQVYILDERQEPVPVGVAGELYIGGEGVARGYVNRGAETAERFMANPFGATAGSRMYRTGDRARYQDDGKVEFLGRADDQVKVRGYRIELGEIEAALNEHPSVGQAIVMAREDEPGEKRLVAYVVAGQQVGSQELRSYLTAKLPDYMVPSAFVQVEQIPLTSNGKVDRRALPRPEANASRGGYVGPRTQVENVLCDIWSEVLGVERVGVEDNFFELGGDSILSIQVIARARQAGLRLTPKQFFERQTVSGLAELAGSGGGVEAEQGELSGPLPLTPIQREFFQRRLARPEHYNQSVLLEVEAGADSLLLKRAVEALVSQHDALRMSYRREGGQWVQSYWAGVADGVYLRVDLSGVGSGERIKAMADDAASRQASLSLGDGRLMLAVEYDLGDVGRRLLVVAHHLCVDGVSWRVLLDDLQEGYEQLRRGEELELDAKTSSYRQWAERLELYSLSDGLLGELDYWQSQQPVAEQMKHEGEGVAERTYATSGREVRWLGEAATRRLLQEVPAAYHTQINDALLAALCEAFGRWGGSRSLVVELEGHGREGLFDDLDVSRTVGWFTSIYPVRLDGGCGHMGEALKRVKERLRAVPNRGIGYGVLKYLSRDERVVSKLGRVGEPEVRFNYLGQLDQVLKTEGVLRPAHEGGGPGVAAENRMACAMDVSGMVVEGRLRVDWVYSRDEYRQERVAELADHYMDALVELIEHCLSEGAGGHTPSDFPLAGLDQASLDKVIAGRRGVEDIYALSGMQQGLLFHTLFEGEAGTYYEQMSCRIDGPLEAGAFERAWQAAVERHAVLRTSFIWEGVSRPVQVVQQGLKVEFRHQDWRGVGGQEQRRRLEELLKEEREQGVDLSKGPLMRLGLVRVGDEAHYFTWGNHHILFDGWCRELIVGEVFKLYEGYVRGERTELGRVRPYRDYIAWLGEQDMGQAERYWRRELGDVQGPTELGIERKADSRAGGYGEKNVRLSEEVSRRLEEAARRWRVTLNAVVEGAWSVVMSRYSGRREVVFGLTVSGRGGGLKGIEGMVGLFINTLPVRLEVSGEEQVSGLMRRVQEKQVELLEYEYSPLMEVQGWSGGGRGAPLFEAIYVFQNYPVDGGIRKQAGSGLRASEITHFDKNNFALALHAAPARELFLELQYDNARFEASDIERLLDHLKQVLEGMAANEQSRVIELPMMSEAALEEVIVGWNRTEADYPRGRCVHELFEQQVKQTPDAVAVVYDGDHITYDGLNRSSNRAARYLRTLGIGPESVVAIAANRGPGFLISMLAIFKAGGCYLPLDPALPTARLENSLIGSKARLVLTTRGSAADIEDKLWKSRCDVAIEVIEDLAQREQNDQNLPTHNDAKNLAYLIYTSGSTGIPKGAMIEQSGMINHLFAKVRDLDLTAQDVIAQTAPQSFDISVWQFLSLLLAGGRVVIVRDEEAQDPVGLIRVLQEQEVTIAEVVPSLLQAVLAELFETRATNSLARLRWMLVTGEAFPSELCRRWVDALPQIQVVNAYGPTECSDDVTHYYANGLSVLNTANVALGRPIANLQVYVLNETLSPCPPGLRGEIYVGGAGVGRGYLDDPPKTAQGFLPDPFSKSIGSRLYRTGDTGRYLEGGEIEYLGRADHQVKVRGHRIELGEIEAAINEQPFVDRAVVLAREDEPGDKRLVCYFVGKQDVSGSLIRESLKERLPGYMVPAAFVQLEQMPLTANGKIDRRALPRPEIYSTTETYLSHHTATEEILCDIWSDILRVEKVGITDNFFELGGHSLLAMQLVSRVRNTLGVEIPLRSLFTNPTVAAVATEIEQLKRFGEKTSGPPLIKTDRGENLPLSFAQQRLWFIDQLEPGTPTYNISSAVRLSGRINVDALQSSLDEIVRRHEVLRTSFPSMDGEPRQQIHESRELRPEMIDLKDSEEAGREDRLREIMQAEARRGFDLSNGPLIRAKLIKMAEEEHILSLVMHHIVSDGWSTEVMVGEFFRLYESFTQGHESPLPELEIQYADYAVWQREWLQGEVLENQLQYWKGKLDGVAVLELPSDRARRPLAVYSGASEGFRIPAELTTKLKQLSKREGVTLFMSLLAGFQALLARYSGQVDIALGTPIAGRNRGEIEGLIGFFVNTLVMRVDFGGDPTVRELLRRVRETALEAYAHQDVPFEKLVEELQPERSLSHQPLFQIMIAMQNVTREAAATAGLTLKGVAMKPASAKFELTLNMVERGDEIHGALEYATELYDGWRIKRLFDHLLQVLERMGEDEQTRVMSLPLLSPQEYKQVVVDWNDTAADYTKELCYHDLFEQQVARTPDAVAATFADQILTYRELNARANQVAHYLRRSGVGVESPVALCVARSLDLIIGRLGILKSGGAYLPLDPASPAERSAKILSDAQVDLLLTRTGVNIVDPQREIKVVRLDADWALIARESEENPEKRATQSHLAYVIYTSGSTGQPKGVEIEHGGLVNLVTWHNQAYRVSASDRKSQLSGLAFDASVWELWPYLVAGASVHIPDEETRADRAKLQAWFVERLITICFLPTPLLEALLDEAWPEGIALRAVLTGGDKLHRWPHEGLPFALVNKYGPTEVTAVTTWAPLEARDEQGQGPPIGRPIANTQIYVLDANQELTPVGVAGEMYIGGIGLARGYRSRPEMTAEKFIPNRFGKESGARLYVTGDIVRYLPDGNLEFLERRDHQVKIRGYRIELGEIETVLQLHPAVVEAVVLAREDDAGEKRLAAYVVAKGEVNERDLRNYLREKLPDYMAPAAIMFLDQMPLTSSGKIDRKSLPRPDRAGSSSEAVVPNTAAEEIICGIWADVLRVEKVGVADNFFDLGGHSLLATQVVSRIRKVLGVEVALRLMFERATVRELAEAVIEARRVGGAGDSPAMARAGRESELPLSYAQQRLWFIQELDPESWAYNIPTAVRIAGPLDTEALRQSLGEIARRHEVLRTRFESRRGEPVQVIHEASDVELAMIEVDAVAEGDRERVAREIAAEVAQRSFDLKRGPVWRASLMRLGEDDHVLVVCMHHVASDAWSSAVLIKEFTELYEAFRGGAQSRLKELEIQYADFAVWQRRWLDGSTLERQMDYWRSQLSGAPMLNLRRIQAPEVTSRKAGKVPFKVTAELTNQLNVLSRREGVTLFMTLLAAYQMVLGRYAKQEDVVVGTDIANRNRLEIEGLIGFFVNQLVLRVKLEGGLSFKELLARVREVTLGADAHQDIPFDKLVEELAPTRDLSRTPLFEASLVLQNVPQEGGRLEGLKVASFPVGEEIAKYTLALRVGESEAGLGGALSYAVNAIHRADAELLVAQLQELLSIVIDECDQSLNVLGTKLDMFATEYRAKRKSSLKSALRTKLLTRYA